MSAEPSTLSDPSAWRPSQLQLIAFPTSPPVSISQDWWKEVAGQEATESVKRPHEKVETGSFGDLSLALTTDILKITWTMTPRIDPENPPLTLPTLGPFPDSRDRFIELMLPWVAKLHNPIKRIGFATILFQDAECHADAYRLLGRYLPSVDVDPESFDFTYRVNRKRPSTSGVPNLSINRVAVWSAAKFSSVIQAIVAGSKTEHVSLPSSKTDYKAMLSMDINSEEREDVIPDANKDRLFAELVAMATEMAISGDIR